MKHYGDITKLSGYTLPTVDVICGGSPCQDLSLAGKRAGLSGERSGLFMEQIRIIREMREKDGSTGRSAFMVRPRYGIWENVPGAFSSNAGKDFQAVLTEFVRIAEPEAPDVPMPESGRWPKSGIILGDGFSISWRLHDAQYWGVPQRRKRIALVADFGGHSAPEILFEREGMRRNPEKGGETRKRTATTAENGVAATGANGRNAYGLTTKGNGDAFITEGKHTSLTAGGGQAGQGYPAMLILNDQGGERMEITENVTGTLRAEDHGHPPLVAYGLEPGAAQRLNPENRIVEDGTPTLRANMGDNQIAVAIVYGISSFDSNAMKSDNPHSGIYEAETARTLDLNGGNPACNQGGMAVVAIEGNGSRPSHKGPGYSEDGVMYTLNTTEQHGVSYVSIENHPQDSRVKINEDGICQSLSAKMGTGGGNVPLVMDVGFFQTYEDKAGTLLARQYKDPPIILQRRFSDVNIIESDVCPTLEAGAGEGGNNLPMIVNPIAIRDDVTPHTADDNVAFTLDTMHRVQAVAMTPPEESEIAIVRRLTPLECERLQGFPDYWTDIGDWIDSKGKKHKGDSDSPRYKALGNSISLPFWQYLARRSAPSTSGISRWEACLMGSAVFHWSLKDAEQRRSGQAKSKNSQ